MLSGAPGLRSAGHASSEDENPRLLSFFETMCAAYGRSMTISVLGPSIFAAIALVCGVAAHLSGDRRPRSRELRDRLPDETRVER